MQVEVLGRNIGTAREVEMVDYFVAAAHDFESKVNGLPSAEVLEINYEEGKFKYYGDDSEVAKEFDILEILWDFDFPKYRHIKRGKEYRLIGDGHIQTELQLSDMDNVAIYMDNEGYLWARRLSEFEDGRFEEL